MLGLITAGVLLFLLWWKHVGSRAFQLHLPPVTGQRLHWVGQGSGSGRWVRAMGQGNGSGQWVRAVGPDS